MPRHRLSAPPEPLEPLEPPEVGAAEDFADELSAKSKPLEPPEPTPTTAAGCAHDWTQEKDEAGVAVYRCKLCYVLGAGPPMHKRSRSGLLGGGF